MNSESSPSPQKAQLQHNPSTPGFSDPPRQSLQSKAGWRRAQHFEITLCELHREALLVHVSSASSLSFTRGPRRTSSPPLVCPRGRANRAGLDAAPYQAWLWA